MYFVVKEEKGYVEFASCSLYIRLTSWRFGMSSLSHARASRTDQRYRGGIAEAEAFRRQHSQRRKIYRSRAEETPCTFQSKYRTMKLPAERSPAKSDFLQLRKIYSGNMETGETGDIRRVFALKHVISEDDSLQIGQV